MAGSFLSPLLRSPQGRVELRNLRTGRVLATRILPAFESAQRRQGLLGREGLDPGEAMILAPSNAVHTFFMRFPLDLAFASRDGRIVKVRAAVPPWRIALALRAFAVIEAPAGTLAASGTQNGDTVALVVVP